MSIQRTATRAVLRQAKLTGRSTRRFESTTSKAADAAKDTASKASNVAADYKAKAAEGLSKASAVAGPALSSAAKGVSSTLGRIGGRTGRLISFIETKVPSAVYYSRVGLELSKLVIKGQKMSPPSVATFQSYYQQALATLKNPSSLLKSIGTPSSLVEQARNLNTAQLAAGGVVFAELLGFFTVGEMIGRRKIVGYRGESGAHH